MKFETAVIVVIMACVFGSFYFSFLSFQTTDTATKLPLVALATSCLITGVVMLACWMAYAGISKVFREGAMNKKASVHSGTNGSVLRMHGP